MRGGLGTRQSLFPSRIAAPFGTGVASGPRRGEAILARDPKLKGPEAEPLKLLLYLFERDDAMWPMRAG
jgi:hypothetical protein